MRFAELQTLAGLRKLQRKGRVEAVREGGEEKWYMLPQE